MKTPNDRNNATLHLRISQRDKQLAERLANENGISMSGLIRMAIKRLNPKSLVSQNG